MTNFIDLEELEACEKAPGDLYLRSGDRLCKLGDPITKEQIDLLKEEEISSLYLLNEDNQNDFNLYTRYKRVALDSSTLSVKGQLQSSLFDQKGELVCKAGDEWTTELAQKLNEKGHQYVYAELSTEKIFQIQKTGQRIKESFLRLAGSEKVDEISEDEKREEERIRETDQLIAQLKSEFHPIPKASLSEKGIADLCMKVLSVKPDSERALAHQVHLQSFPKDRKESEKTQIVDLHKNCVARIKDVCRTVLNSELADASEIGGMAKDIIREIMMDQSMMLNTAFLADGPMEEYTLRQSVNRGIYAMGIATAMNFSAQQIFELSFGAFLHDIGMMKVPRGIVMKKGKLTDLERSEILKHCSYSISMLQSISGVPMVAPIIVYQCHERGDRGGYPRRLKLTSLHIYSKVVMVADIYCAMISARPYRKAFQPDQAINYMIQEAKKNQLDKTCVAALLRMVSRYPIGSTVLLSDECIGKVTALSRFDPAEQVVQILFEQAKRVTESKTVDLAQLAHVSVLKCVDPERLKIDPMVGF